MPRRKTADTAAQRPDEGAIEVSAPTAPEAAETGVTRAPPRDGTKIATVLDLLRQPGGTTIADISAATGWQAHTVRGALAGAIGKRMGLKVISHKEKGEARRYRLANPEGQFFAAPITDPKGRKLAAAWGVWAPMPLGGRALRSKHKTEAEAIAEAERRNSAS